MEMKLLSPGPVPIPNWVSAELARPPIHHRSPEFSATLKSCLESLQPLFQTKNACFILNASGSGAMEAGLLNTIERGSEVLIINGGKFGQRWQQMAQSHGYVAHNLDFDWGKNIDLNKVEGTLKAHPQISAILCQACETSTGLLLPTQQIAQLAKKHSCFFLVDGITAVGSLPVKMDEWEIDVLISGSQKAFMLPAGLAFLSLSQRALEKAKTLAPKQTYYWDLISEHEANKKDQTRFSSSVALIRGLHVVLEHIHKMGLSEWFEQTQKRADTFRQTVLNHNVQLFPETSSPSLTCLRFANQIDVNQLRKDLKNNHGFWVAGGQAQLNGTVLRIGHMGDISLQELRNCAEAINTLCAETHN